MLLYAGWCPLVKGSNYNDDVLTLHKGTYKITMNHSHVRFKCNDRLIVAFNLKQFSFDSQRYHIRVKIKQFSQRRINLLHPKDNRLEWSFDLNKTLNFCKKLLEDWIKKNGEFPMLYPFKRLIEKQLHTTYDGATFIFKQGINTHWNRKRSFNKNMKCFMGFRVIPAYPGRGDAKVGPPETEPSSQVTTTQETTERETPLPTL